MHHTEDMTIEQTITEMPETPGRGGYLCCCACLVWEDFETSCRVGGDFVFLFFCSLYLIVRRWIFLDKAICAPERLGEPVRPACERTYRHGYANGPLTGGPFRYSQLPTSSVRLGL